MTPAASIVIPSRGGAERLPHLFEALRQQTEPSWEAIVVVDGDVDDTESVVRAAGKELPVRAIVLDRNQGRSVALNTGFLAADGEVLIRCDDDLRPAPNWVGAHVGAHTAGPVGAVGLCRNVFPDTPYAQVYGRPRDERFRQDAYRAPAERRWRYWGGNVSASRELFRAVGPYDTAFRAYGWEDVDWGYRVHDLGVPVRILPELETDHHIAATTTRVRVARAFHSGAAKLTFVAKHGTDALGQAPAERGAWSRLVGLTGRHAGLARLSGWAEMADRGADRLPVWLAEKHISWLVESAAISGEHHRDEVSTAL